ncbi:hypothetical protein ACS5NO_17510 [Larkinella sp. GY13]|uniref:hypothetical protein n=1 Tax=Larkinella sp. GY13 TaxID=3453720 RepID=UPI003EE8A045
MLQTRVNGEIADLAPKGSVDLELVNPYLTYETLFTSSAKLPALPLSARNRRLFGFQDELQVATGPERMVVQQYYNGHLVQEGIGLATVDSSGFQLSVVQPLGEFFGDYQTVPLSEIDFGTIALPATLTPVLTAAGQDAVCFPTIQNPDYYGTNGAGIGYGGRVNPYVAGVYTAGPNVPMVFVRWLLLQIAAKTGTTISGTILDHPQLSKLVLYNTRALDGAADVTIRNHLPTWTIPQLLIELRKVFNLAFDFQAVQGRLTTSLTDDIFKAPVVKDWSGKAVKQYKRRAEVNRRLQLSFELDSSDALLKDKPGELADYLTPAGVDPTGIAKLSAKLGTLLYDPATGLASARQPGVTAAFNQSTQGWMPRLLFWNGLEDDLPLALPTLDGLSLYWLGMGGLAATFWNELEAFRTRMFYVERELLLNETDLATLNFKEKIHINGVNYLVVQVMVSLPVRMPAKCFLVRV